MLEVMQPGLLSTPQDMGRPGHARLGIGRSGAADWTALHLANALVGNPADACAIEITLKGPVLKAQASHWVALAGAPLPQARINDDPWPMGVARLVQRGDHLSPGGMSSGCRSYLAVAGGIDLDPWLGSRSCDVNAGLGPSPLQAGDELPVGPANRVLPHAFDWALDLRPWQHASRPRTLRLLESAHTGQLNDTSLKLLGDATFRINPHSNRVGTRLDGPELHLEKPLEMISAGSVAGSMQLPPGGQPIVLGCEHPVSGGYPRIAQVIEADLPRLAQCRPGDEVRFEWVDMATALDARRAQRQLIEQIELQIRRRLEQAA